MGLLQLTEQNESFSEKRLEQTSILVFTVRPWVFQPRPKVPKMKLISVLAMM